MNPPRVSVIVAFHDRVDYLEGAVASVVSQGPDLDVVLVDDGSTDGSSAVAAAFVPPARLVRQPNLGCAAAWNAGLDLAAGELVAFCDSDDLWVPGRMGPLLARLDGDTGGAPVDVVFGYTDEFLSPEVGPDDPGPTGLALRAPRRHTFAPVSGAMVARRSVFERVGRFDPGLRQGHWVDWYARLRDGEVPVAVVPDVVLRRRLHGGNSSLVRHDDLGEFARALHASLVRRRSRTR